MHLMKGLQFRISRKFKRLLYLVKLYKKQNKTILSKKQQHKNMIMNVQSMEFSNF